MKVFVAGATGVIGRRAVAQLLAAGAEVTGVARSAPKQADLHELGATAARVSLFDRRALTAAVAGHDVVVNLATAIPTGERAGSRSAWNDNHRIRREGSHNLVDAALAAGAQRYVQESIALLYADGGDELLDESAPVDATWITASALDAEAEAARFGAHGGAGIALRFGSLYGPDSAHTVDEINAARSGMAGDLAPGTASRPSVTTEDAASAVVAALGAPSGVYNVADDQPLRRAEYFEALARVLGTGPLALPPVTATLPPDFSMTQRSQRVSNQRLKVVTGWQPRFPSAREGWPFVTANLSGIEAADRL